MVRSIKQQVTIQPGGVIELRRPDLRAGASAEVTVTFEDAAPPPLTALFGKAKPSFTSAQEADAFIRGERDASHSCQVVSLRGK